MLVVILYILLISLTEGIPRNVHFGRYRLVMFCLALSIQILGQFTIITVYLLFFHFAMFYDTLKKFIWRKQRNNHTSESLANGEYGTFKESSRCTVPSSTYFNIEYTGEFTTVSKV